MNIKNYLDYNGLLYWKQKFQAWATNTFVKIKDMPTSLPASDVSPWAKAPTKPTYTKSEVGLSNVDNTSDVNKPISALQQVALDDKVDKVSGKQLSTNDYTTAEKTKLKGIAAGAEVNVQPDFLTSDSASKSFIKNKPTIPTKTSQLSNDSNYVDKPSMNTAINTAIASAQGGVFVKLTSGQYGSDGIPTINGENGKIYLVPNSGAAPNVFNEYFWDSENSKFELLGSTTIDLSGYLKETDFIPLTNAQIDEIMLTS